jgi:hypothetical protein
VKMLDGLTEEQILKVNIPTGIPLVYELDDQLRSTRQPLPRRPRSREARRRGGGQPGKGLISPPARVACCRAGCVAEEQPYGGLL